jgi:type I restriction enzyme M protein
VIKASLKKDSKTKQAKSISITTELTQDLQKDYEIIPYSPDEATNQKTLPILWRSMCLNLLSIWTM